MGSETRPFRQPFGGRMAIDYIRRVTEGVLCLEHMGSKKRCG